MELTLTVTSFNNRSPDSRLSYTWSKQGGTIGRAVNNDWVLPDAQCYLSGQHAVIEYRSGEFFIIDTSTNGVFVNHNSRPLGRGNELRLQQGDQLRFGLYELQVNLVSHQPDVNHQNDFPISPNLSVASYNQQIHNKNSATDDADPFGFLSNPADAYHKLSKQQPKFTAAPIADQACYLPELIQPLPLNEQTPIEAVGVPQGWLEAAASQMSASPVPKESLFIPENSLELNKRSTAESVEEDLVLDPFFISQLTPIPTPIEQAITVKPSQIELPTSEQLKPIITVDAKQAFLKGLGLNDSDQQLKLTSAKDWESIGLLLRLAVQGTLDILQARAEVKAAMHMELTTIQRRNNNPLKFALNAEDALTQLLINPSEAYLSPDQAMAEAYSDIRAHQLAVIAGMQSALQQVLRRFEPNKLIERLEKESPISASIPVQRQAKLWSLFEDLYAALEQECTDDFQRLFGLEFARAYEEQIAQLKRET